jgi:hypothetical protein
VGSLLLIMLPGVMVASPGDVVVAIPVMVKTLVVVDEETSPSKITSFLLANRVDALIIPFSSATNGLIQCIWEKTKVQTKPTHMVLIQIGTRTREQQTMSLENSTSLP